MGRHRTREFEKKRLGDMVVSPVPNAQCGDPSGDPSVLTNCFQ